MNARKIPNSDAVAHRRERLKKWIDDRFAGVQAAFVASTNDGKSQVNSGEVSGLLRDKAFGEKRARTLEPKAGMPTGYLDAYDDETENLIGAAVEPQTHWPFSVGAYERLKSLQTALGPRRGNAAIKDIEKYLVAAVQKWENELAPRGNRS